MTTSAVSSSEPSMSVYLFQEDKVFFNCNSLPFSWLECPMRLYTRAGVFFLVNIQDSWPADGCGLIWQYNQVPPMKGARYTPTRGAEGSEQIGSNKETRKIPEPRGGIEHRAHSLWNEQLAMTLTTQPTRPCWRVTETIPKWVLTNGRIYQEMDLFWRSGRRKIMQLLAILCS
jgi:hypothetical protein